MQVPGEWCSSPRGMAVARAAWDGSDLLVIKAQGFNYPSQLSPTWWGMKGSVDVKYQGDGGRAGKEAP